MNVTERVAYLRGLLEGMELDTDKKEGKVWKAVLSVLEELAESVTDLEQQNAALSEELDDIYEELSVIEEDFLDDDEDGFFDDEDEPLYQVICPTCNEVIYMDDDLLSEGCTVCPACGEELEFDLSDLTDEDLAESMIESVENAQEDS